MGDDFIFGVTKFTDHVVRKRQDELRTVWHAHRTTPRDPLPGQPVEITVDVGTGHRADAVYCYWTTDDEEPLGRGGVAVRGRVLPLEEVGPEWEELAWGYVSRWRGVLPGQPEMPSLTAAPLPIPAGRTPGPYHPSPITSIAGVPRSGSAMP